jgi:hypothetical protein
MRTSKTGAAIRGIHELLQRAEAEPSHLPTAVLASKVAEEAQWLARAEVMAARDEDGATWEDIGTAFGVSRQTAHERFRTGPDGLHSRLFKQKVSQSAMSSSGAAVLSMRGKDR